LKSVIERLRLDKAELDEQLNEAHAALTSNEAEIRKLEEAANLEFERSKSETARNAHIVEELEKEVFHLFYLGSSKKLLYVILFMCANFMINNEELSI